MAVEFVESAPIGTRLTGCEGHKVHFSCSLFITPRLSVCVCLVYGPFPYGRMPDRSVGRTAPVPRGFRAVAENDGSVVWVQMLSAGRRENMSWVIEPVQLSEGH